MQHGTCTNLSVLTFFRQTINFILCFFSIKTFGTKNNFFYHLIYESNYELFLFSLQTIKSICFHMKKLRSFNWYSLFSPFFIDVFTHFFSSLFVLGTIAIWKILSLWSFYLFYFFIRNVCHEIDERNTDKNRTHYSCEWVVPLTSRKQIMSGAVRLSMKFHIGWCRFSWRQKRLKFPSKFKYWFALINWYSWHSSFFNELMEFTQRTFDIILLASLKR